MNSVAAQQVALDNTLVAPKKRLKIEKCNARIEFSKPQRKDTYQVILDALKLPSCYPAFLITTKICSVLPDQDFIEPPSDEELVPFIQETGYSGKCDMLSAIHTDQMHQPWRTFAAIINRCISGKTTGLDRLKLLRAQILWGMFYQKNVDYVALLWEDFMFQADNRDISPARKEHMPYPRFTKVIINHFIFKDKTISMRNMINLHTIRDDSLLGTLKFVSKTEDYQKYRALILNEMINQDIKDSKAYKTYIAFATGQAAPKKARKFKKSTLPSKKLSFVIEEEPAKKSKQAKKLAKKSTTVPTTSVVIKDTLGVSMSKKKAPAKVDRDKGIDLLFDVALLEDAHLKKAHKKSKQDSHMLHASSSSEGVGSQPKGDSEDDDSNDNDRDDVRKNDDDDVDSDAEASDSERTDSNEDVNPNLNQNDDEEEDDEEELKDLVHKKEGKGDAEMTDVGHDEKSYEQVKVDAHVILTATHVTQKTEVVSMMNVKVRHEEPSIQTPSLLIVPETSTAAATTILPKEVSDFTTPVIQRTITESLDNVVLAKSSSQLQLTYEATTSLTKFELKKILLNKLQKNQGLKKRKTSKDVEPSKGLKLKESRKGTKSQSKSSSKSVQAKESVFEAVDTDMPRNQGSDLEHLVGPAFNLLKGTCRSRMELKYHFEECYKVVTNRLDWNNPEGREYPFDLSKPLPLIKDRGRQVVLVDYLFNNDLEYMKGRSSSSKYMTSTTKTKAAKYDDIQGIKDMVSKHDVFSTKRIIAVTHVKVMKWYDYGHLEEIEVRREDQKLYKFKEGDFPRLNLRDIEDMLLLLVQKKISNLKRDVIYDLNVALQMFTRRVVIQKRVEDL
ncbi:hypothetical protein Tco_0268090 [Tanacetum coccineum]